MALQTYIERLKYVDNLIKREASGNLNSLAKKLNLSRSHTVVFLKQMKDHGFPIKFCRKRCCYYYTEHGGLVRNLFQSNKIDNERELSPDKLRKISGGTTILHIFPRADYISMRDCNFMFFNH